MDTSTSCDSTSTSAPVRLGLRLLTCAPPVFAFCFHMTVDCVAFELLSSCFRVDSVDSDCTCHYGCVPLYGAGGACMYANPGARERAFNFSSSFGGAQLRTLRLRRTAF